MGALPSPHYGCGLRQRGRWVIACFGNHVSSARTRAKSERWRCLPVYFLRQARSLQYHVMKTYLLEAVQARWFMSVR